MTRIFIYLLPALILIGCSDQKKDAKQPEPDEVLPILGRHDVDVNGDTIYHKIPDFVFTNQDSNIISQSDLKGSIYVANFFFTSCPNICPKVTNQIKRLQAMTEDIKNLRFLSHTVDPERDTLEKIRNYIKKYNINTTNWDFLRGSKDYVYEIAEQGYQATAAENDQAEGGYIHSSYLILIDKKGRIRGVHEGTETAEVDSMAEDINKLSEAYQHD